MRRVEMARAEKAWFCLFRQRRLTLLQIDGTLLDRLADIVDPPARLEAAAGRHLTGVPFSVTG